jgi:hypothetical protein
MPRRLRPSDGGGANQARFPSAARLRVRNEVSRGHPSGVAGERLGRDLHGHILLQLCSLGDAVRYRVTPAMPHELFDLSS